MEQQINPKVNRIVAFFLVLLLSSCVNSNLVDVNMEIPDNSWTYAKNVRAVVEIKDSSTRYNLFFKVRNTADYRYSNIYVVMRLKGNTLSKSLRHQFQLAKSDGKWLGRGSGDLYSNTFLLLKDFRFPKTGKYELVVEQNMRDNPLVGISDVGLSIESAAKD